MESPQPKRTQDQSAKLWSIATDISRSGKTWGGIKLSKENWYRLLVGAVYKQRMVPDLTGDGFFFVNVSTSSPGFGKMRYSEVIAFAEAWCAEQGIELSDGELQEQETS